MPVAIGLVGAGRGASEAYAPALAACPDVEFAGVWARSPEPARNVAERFDAQTCQRFDDLLDLCDGVVFAVPPGIQADLATAAAHRGKAILLNLPISEDLAGAEQLANAVTALNVVSQLALAWRYTPAVRTFLTVEARRTLPQGGTGRVVSGLLSARHVTSAWRRERGVLLDQGADLVDLLEAALGPAVTIQAHGERQGWVGLLLEHEGGRFSEASMSGTASPGTSHAEVEVFGPGGSAAVDCAAAVGPDTFQTMIQEFATAVDSGKPPELDAQHGLHLQRLLDAADTELFRSS
jgi:predicted dehydrogenase